MSTSMRISPPSPYTLVVVVVACAGGLRVPRIGSGTLAGIPKAQLLSNVEKFASQKGLTDILPLLKKRALVTQDPPAFEKIEELDEDDRIALRREITHKWSQPRVLYLTVILCSIGAAVQYVSCAFSRFLPLIAYLVLRACAGVGIRPVRTAPTCLSLPISVFFLWKGPQTMTRTIGLSVW